MATVTDLPTPHRSKYRLFWLIRQKKTLEATQNPRYTRITTNSREKSAKPAPAELNIACNQVGPPVLGTSQPDRAALARFSIIIANLTSRSPNSQLGARVALYRTKRLLFYGRDLPFCLRARNPNPSYAHGGASGHCVGVARPDFVLLSSRLNVRIFAFNAD